VSERSRGGLVGGLVGGVAGAVGGEAAVNQIWSTSKQILSYLTGEPTARIVVYLDPQIQQQVTTLRQQLADSGIPSDQAEVFISLTQAEWAQRVKTNPNLTLSDVAHDLVDNVQTNQQTPTIEGTGPTVAVESTPATNGQGSGQNIEVFDSDGKAQATVLKNADGSSSAVNYNAAGAVKEGASLTPDGTTSEKITNQADGSQLYTSNGTDGSGGTVQDQQYFGSGGDQQYEQITTTSVDGQVSAVVSGTGAVVTLSDATIFVADGAQATVGGTGNVIVGGSEADLTVAGDDNTLILQSGATANLTGGNTEIHLSDYVFQGSNGNYIVVSDDGDEIATTRTDGTSQVSKLNQDGFQLEQSDYDAINNLIDRNLKTYEGITFNETYENGTGTQVKATDPNGNVRTFNAGDLGQSLGSTIGSFLGGNSLEGRIAASTVVGLIGRGLGTVLQQSGNWAQNITAIGAGGQSLADQTVGNAAGGLNVSDAFAGGLSSLLVGEAAQALGIHGFAGVVFTSIGTSITTQLVKNLGSIALQAGTEGIGEISSAALFAGFEGADFALNLENGIGGAVGGFLASQLVHATSIEGSIGGSIGSTIGAFIGTFIPIPFVGTFIGSFLGDIFGTLIGDLFGGDPEPAWSIINEGGVSGQFGATRFMSDNGGNFDNLRPISDDIDAVANQFVAMTGGQVTGLGGSGVEAFHQDTNGIYVTRPDGSTVMFDDGSGGWANFLQSGHHGVAAERETGRWRRDHDGSARRRGPAGFQYERGRGRHAGRAGL